MSVQVDPSDVERVTFAQREPADGSPQTWEMLTPAGAIFARAEVFPGAEQWGVRVADGAPSLTDADLMRLVARLLVWEAGCTTETVDVVLSRTHDHTTLVRVGGDYV